MKPSLTPKQEKFCHLYLECGNASEAYRKSYSTSKMKSETIKRKAKELLDHPKITATLRQLQNELEKAEIIKKEEILRDLRDVYWVNGIDVLDIQLERKMKHDEKTGLDIVEIRPKVLIKDLEELTQAQKRAISSIKVDKDGNFEISFYDRKWISDRICKMLGFDAPKEKEVTMKFEQLSEDQIDSLLKKMIENGE